MPHNEKMVYVHNTSCSVYTALFGHSLLLVHGSSVPYSDIHSHGINVIHAKHQGNQIPYHEVPLGSLVPLLACSTHGGRCYLHVFLCRSTYICSENTHPLLICLSKCGRGYFHSLLFALEFCSYALSSRHWGQVVELPCVSSEVCLNTEVLPSICQNDDSTQCHCSDNTRPHH